MVDYIITLVNIDWTATAPSKTTKKEKYVSKRLMSLRRFAKLSRTSIAARAGDLGDKRATVIAASLVISILSPSEFMMYVVARWCD